MRVGSAKAVVDCKRVRAKRIANRNLESIARKGAEEGKGQDGKGKEETCRKPKLSLRSGRAFRSGWDVKNTT